MKYLGSYGLWLAAATTVVAWNPATAAVVDDSFGDAVSIIVTATAAAQLSAGHATDKAAALSTGELHASVLAYKQLPDPPSLPIASQTTTGTINFVNALNSAAAVTASGTLAGSSALCSTCGGSGNAEVSFLVRFHSDVDTNYVLDLGYAGATTAGGLGSSEILGNVLLRDFFGGSSSTAFSTGYVNQSAHPGSHPETYTYYGTILAGHIYDFSYLLQLNNSGEGAYASTGYNVSLDFTPVPLPAAAWLLLSGVGALAPLVRRKRQVLRAAV